MCFHAVSAAVLALAAGCGRGSHREHVSGRGLNPRMNVHSNSACDERRIREQEERAQEEFAREQSTRLAEERAEERGRHDTCDCRRDRGATRWHPSCPHCR